jgi:hypothetical protein
VEKNTPYIPTSNNTWCASPWTEIHIDQEGEIIFCCQAKDVVGNVKTDSIKEIFNGRLYKKARLETISNIWPKGCHLCERAEKVVDRSMRYQQQETYEANLDPVIPDITKDYKIQKFKIDFFFFFFKRKNIHLFEQYDFVGTLRLDIIVGTLHWTNTDIQHLTLTTLNT